jgi:beta-galactosidase
VSPSGLTVGGSGFQRDGAPHQILSGAMHYFRVHPDLWADRLHRLRAMGLNTVETYVAWNFHEPTPGTYDFTGWRDVARFVALAAEQQLDVIVRPGPYICAEWDLGGLPTWLLADPASRLRCLDPGYLAAVDRWFDMLIPRLTPLLAGTGGPIVAVQVENEYGSYGDDAGYLAYLRDGLRRRGVTGLLVTSDGPAESMLDAGRVPGALATVNFGSGAAEAFTQLRRFQPSGPQMCMEFWNGWFDHWGEEHHVRDPDSAVAELETMLRSGASVSFYMAHGGSNFGLWNGANLEGGRYQPTVTSYDYDAPIAESGVLTEKFHRYRAAIAAAGLRPDGTLPDGTPPDGIAPDEPLPGDPPRLAPQVIPVEASAPLLPQLGQLADPVTAPVPLTMEQVGQRSGLIHYRASPRIPAGPSSVTVKDLRDRAQVFVDGRPAGVLDRNDGETRLAVHGTGRQVTLEILVENQGRVNYGPLLGERKGILGGVLIGDRYVFGWETTPLPLDDPARFRFGEPPGDGPPDDGPSLHYARVQLDRPADGFLAFPGWEKGFAWLNGFLLGRYWAVGPQRTLYAPAPLWRAGDNELIVLELHGHGESIELAAGPGLALCGGVQQQGSGQRGGGEQQAGGQVDRLVAEEDGGELAQRGARPVVAGRAGAGDLPADAGAAGRHGRAEHVKVAGHDDTLGAGAEPLHDRLAVGQVLLGAG